MEIKDENIRKLMKYFDDVREAAYINADSNNFNYKIGLISEKEYLSRQNEIFSLPFEHDRIRKMLFGNEG